MEATALMRRSVVAALIEYAPPPQTPMIPIRSALT